MQKHLETRSLSHFSLISFFFQGHAHALDLFSPSAHKPPSTVVDSRHACVCVYYCRTYCHLSHTHTLSLSLSPCLMEFRSLINAHTSRDGNPLIDGRGSRRRKRGRLDAVERGRGHVGWKKDVYTRRNDEPYFIS